MSKEKKQKDKKPKKKLRILKFILIILLIAVIGVGVFLGYKTHKNGGGVSGFIKTVSGYDEEKLKDLDEFKVLILGISTDTSAVLTDTMIVASYNPKTQQATMLSVPRDTFWGTNESSATSYNKINALYQSGIDKVLKEVNTLTGLDIEHYVIIDTEALIKLVDAIGGVQFDVPIDMDYDDTSQDLHIHFKAGLQTLDGEKAENLVRFRHNNNGTSYPSSYGDNDIGRMRTQREFITQVVKQTLQLKNITKIKELLDIVYDYVKTNISLSTIKDYIPYAVDFNTDNIKTGTLPGTATKINGLWFYKVNKTEAQQLVNELFETTEGEESESTSDNQNEIDKKANAKIKIELVNASGSDSILATVETLLKKQGYTISKTSSVDSTKNTTIINNTNIQQSDVENIKNTIDKGVIQSGQNSTSSTDVTIILGTNYNK